VHSGLAQVEALAEAAPAELVQAVWVQVVWVQEVWVQVVWVQAVWVQAVWVRALAQALHHHQCQQQDSCHKSVGNSSSQYHHTTHGCTDSHICHRLHLSKVRLFHLH